MYLYNLVLSVISFSIITTANPLPQSDEDALPLTTPPTPADLATWGDLIPPDFNPVNLTSITSVACNKAPVYFFWRRIRIASCIHALRLFPANDSQETFHSLPPADEYILPEFRRSEDCEVDVGLYMGSQNVKSSWLDVRQAGAELAYVCRMKNDETLTRGGSARTGDGQGIVLTVKKVSDGTTQEAEEISAN
ncbi:MAG: hypothetical protein LQ342_007888 [Letrouitia transgressa]|nr:MAG: hypothetical protein LQ342_007888 [Letrouitia transgressa]